jgi:drug/metabolite transporter (DMT)-like permease
VDGSVFAAMLASAALHAIWNAWAKSRPDPQDSLAAIIVAAGWPSAIVALFTGLPAPESWPWIFLTVAISIPAQVFLGSAYREGDFAVAYPILRSLNPMAVALAAVPIFGEELALVNAAGVVAVSTGVALVGWEALTRSRTMTLRGLGFACLAALITAIAALCDFVGARVAAEPLTYAPLVTISNAVAMACVQARRTPLVPLVARNWQLALFGPLLSNASYLLAIWAIQRAPVAQVVSLRETSMLFAVLIGACVLRERVGPWRWAAVASMFAGVLLLRA